MPTNSTALTGPQRLEGQSGVPPFVEFFDDFVVGGYCPDAALSSESDPAAKFSEVADRGEWLVTRDAAPTLVIKDDEPGGVLRITTGGNANDFVSCQLNGEAFKVAAEKDIYFEARVKLADADDTQWFIGLATTDVTGSTLGPILDGTTESIGFRQNADTGVDIDCLTEDASTETETDSGVDVADDTFVILGFHVISDTDVKFFVNGSEVARHTSNIPDGDAVTLTMEVHSPTASSTLEVDYIWCRQER